MFQENPNSELQPAPRIAFSVQLLLLSLCVVLWGTAYKLSLYHPAEHGDVPAKLCTRFSDVAKANVQQAAMQPVISPEIVLAAVEAMEPQQTVEHRRMLGTPRPRAIPLTVRPHSLLRPPPSFLFAHV